MRKIFLGLLMLGAFTAFAQEENVESCSVKVLADDRFELHDASACIGSCDNYERRKARASNQNKLSVMNKISNSLGKNDFHLVENQKDSSYTLEIKSERTFSSEGWGYSEYFTRVNLILKDSKGSIIEEVSGDSRHMKMDDDRYAGRAYTFRKHVSALRKALSKIQTKCHTF